ncbi:MAG: hypothetical protein M1833_006700 [Piccolia ochrophora]|nr:MAG: hypothetical protein M1833_006700 [Piccolia ochrophora]
MDRICWRCIASRTTARGRRPRSQLCTPLKPSKRWSSTGAATNDASTILDKPTWSVRSLLPPSEDSVDTQPVTPKQLHHLLRLSALPPPASPEAEESMLRTLRSQLHFVKEVQNVDTAGVEPLRSIRDETKKAEVENMITIESLKDAFAQEQRVGPFERIRKKQGLPVDTKGAEDWEPLSLASRKVGRYFVVQRGKETTS